jgi:hypothetical protein
MIYRMIACSSGEPAMPKIPTLNQRVQGSSPCAPTNKINYLRWFLAAENTL